MRDLLTTMPNVKDRTPQRLVVTDIFLRLDPLSRMEGPPSLRHLPPDDFTLQHGDGWSPLIHLIYQTSGDQAISLILSGERAPIPPEVVREIDDLIGGSASAGRVPIEDEN